MITSQFQPYRTGWEIRPVRLAPNTTALTTAATAMIDPRRVDRTGTDRTPTPGSSALRAATRAGAAAGPRRQQPEQHHEEQCGTGADEGPVGVDPTVRVIPAHRPDRGLRG